MNNKEIIMKQYDQIMNLQNTVANQAIDVSGYKVRMDTLENEVKRLYDLSNENYAVLEKKIDLNIKKMNHAFKNLQTSCENEVALLRASVLEKKIDNASQGLDQKKFQNRKEEKSKHDLAGLKKKYNLYKESESKLF